MIFIAAHEPGAFGIMQKSNCLCGDDFAMVDHCQRFVERRLQDFNFLAFAYEPAAFASPVLGFISRDEEGQLLAKASRAHTGLENTAHVPHHKSGFFLDDPGFGVLAIEPACTDFDQAFTTVLQICGQAKPTRETDTRAARIVEQNGGAIAWFVDLGKGFERAHRDAFVRL
ncbi:MAG: hypothetical protein ACREDD_12405 [Methylocella sp.]